MEKCRGESAKMHPFMLDKMLKKDVSLDPIFGVWYSYLVIYFSVDDTAGEALANEECLKIVKGLVHDPGQPDLCVHANHPA